MAENVQWRLGMAVHILKGTQHVIAGLALRTSVRNPVEAVRLGEPQSQVLTTPNGMPELPANGLSDTSQLAHLKRVRTITAGMIALGRSPETYAYVKETVQRNLYRIPLR